MKTLLMLAVMAEFISGCSMMQLISKLKREDEITLSVWQRARAELRQTCVQSPDVCQPRWLMKIPRQGRITVADWEYENFPPYQAIIDTHERLFRQAKNSGWRSGDFGDLWLNEEILFAIARALAKRSDEGEISPEQGKAAFTEAWNKNFDETVKHLTLLVQEAKTADDTAIKTATVVLTAVAAAASVALVAAAAAQPTYTYSYYSSPAPPPVYRPIYCNAYRTFGGYQISCY